MMILVGSRPGAGPRVSRAEAFMVPLAPAAAESVLAQVEGTRRAVALQHAAIWRRPGLWGDHPSRPRSLVLLREGDGQWDAFGAGEPEPAVSWMAAQTGTVALLAPPTWEAAVRRVVSGPVQQSRIDVGICRQSDLGPARPAIATRRLTAADAVGFAAMAPAWAFRGWGSFSDLVDNGVGFGVPYGAGFAALAWVLERGWRLDALGVVVAPRFRRLGLGRAVAAALMAHLLGPGGRRPLWAAAPANVASRALGRVLGFTPLPDEALLRWSAGP